MVTEHTKGGKNVDVSRFAHCDVTALGARSFSALLDRVTAVTHSLGVSGGKWKSP